MLTTTIKGLAARKLRLFATALAILLGVAFMAGTFVLTDTIDKTFHDLFGSVYAHTDAVVRGRAAIESAASSGLDGQRPPVDEALVDTITRVPGVHAAEGNVMGYAQLVDKRGKALGKVTSALGFNWNRVAELNPFNLVAGRAPLADDEVVIDKASADQAGFAVGDTATVLVQAGPQRLRVVGITRFGTADSVASGSGVLFTQAAAQHLVGEPGRFDDIGVVADRGVSQEQLRDRLAAALPGADVVTGKEIVAENQRTLKPILKLLNRALLVFALIALFVGSFIIYNTFSIVVAQRAREMALLRAIGASRRQVLGSVLLEAVVVGLLAALLGVAAGIGVAVGLRALLVGSGFFDIPAGGIVLLPRTVAVSLLAGVLVSAASAVLPARKAAKVPPVAALRDLARDTSGHSRRRVVIGAVVTAAGMASLSFGLLARPNDGIPPVGVGAAIIFVGVAVLGPVIAGPAGRLIGWPLPVLKGMAGTLARENAVRNPKRTSSTAAALMIGVSLVAFITILASSARGAADAQVDKNFTGDFLLDAGGFPALSPDLARRLDRLPEVGAASGVRSNLAEIDGATSDLVAVDPSSYGRIVDLGVTEGRLEDLDSDGVAVLATVARAKGWSVGDEIRVRFPATGERRLTVAMTFRNKQYVNSSYVIGLPAYDANFTDHLDSQVVVERAEGVSLSAARAAVERVTADYPTARVQDRAEYKQAQYGEINRTLGLVYVLLALAVLIALLGIANTLALSVFERTRELGLLRAVGMARRQVRTMVRWESVIIALFGTGMGLAIGLFFSWALVKAGPDQATLTVPVGQLAAITLVAAVAGVVAAILPARRASRLDVLAAIATE
jgi:putative ABC transport system permease protein